MAIHPFSRHTGYCWAPTMRTMQIYLACSTSFTSIPLLVQLLLSATYHASMERTTHLPRHTLFVHTSSCFVGVISGLTVGHPSLIGSITKRYTTVKRRARKRNLPLKRKVELSLQRGVTERWELVYESTSLVLGVDNELVLRDECPY